VANRYIRGEGVKGKGIPGLQGFGFKNLLGELRREMGGNRNRFFGWGLTKQRGLLWRPGTQNGGVSVIHRDTGIVGKRKKGSV